MTDPSKNKQKFNWMKNQTVGNAISVEASSVSHIQDIVKDYVKYPSPVRPAGHILSPTAICSNDGGTTVSTLKLNQIHGIKYIQIPNGHHDQAGETIPCLDVDCGVTLREAQKYVLENSSLELPFSAEIGLSTIGGTAFAVTKDNSIGESPVKDMGLGTVGSMIWSVDVVESDGRLKTYCFMNENDGTINMDFQALLDSYGTRGIAVRMLLTMRPKTPITTTLDVFPFKKDKVSHAECTDTLLERWKKASDVKGNILALISHRNGYVLVEKRLPTDNNEEGANKRKLLAPFSLFLAPFYHWVKRFYGQRGYLPYWISLLGFLGGTFALRFKTSSRYPGNDYDLDVPSEKSKVTFTFASFSMDDFKEIATSLLDFTSDYEEKFGFAPEVTVMYVVTISGHRVAGPFKGKNKNEMYRFCFDPIYTNPNDKKWEDFLVAFNEIARKKGGRASLNQTQMLEKDVLFGANAISSGGNNISPRFVSPWLQQFLDADKMEKV